MRPAEFISGVIRKLISSKVKLSLKALLSLKVKLSLKAKLSLPLSLAIARKHGRAKEFICFSPARTRTLFISFSSIISAMMASASRSVNLPSS